MKCIGCVDLTSHAQGVDFRQDFDPGVEELMLDGPLNGLAPGRSSAARPSQELVCNHTLAIVQLVAADIVDQLSGLDPHLDAALVRVDPLLQFVPDAIDFCLPTASVLPGVGGGNVPRSQRKCDVITARATPSLLPLLLAIQSCAERTALPPRPAGQCD